MSNQTQSNTRVSALLDALGDGLDGSAPTSQQWQRILGRDQDAPLTLVNFFKLNDKAAYRDGTTGTGQEAFDRYAAVSMPTMERVGGKFLLAAPFAGMFAGQEEDWDLVVLGSYPNTRALFALFEDGEYQKVFHHRTAACARQKVLVVNG
ncbi:DUF1330 domain-containing protein [Sneathiella chungangensis]|uniref:DUF1330 domain-containing protein n=1 Tax=Sneathiella chungangensis TaxID=1418234 RepID=A0A845MKQ6_9PROT|nr:DUF1330 domain-containing protein [Sneathiella chungangensis]MZR23920.1 DUF1330 domain-containing protein [Sneathiella chungangensis]